MANTIARRHLVTIGAALGGLGLTRHVRAAAPPPARRIEQFDAELGTILDRSQPIQQLATGLAGNLGPTEGPVWWKEGGYLLFEDIHASRRMKYRPGQGVSVVKE